MPDIAVELVIVALLIMLNGAFAMAEMAVVSSRKARLEHRAVRGDRRAAAALKLANEPGPFLSTVQIGITMVGILAGAFGGATASRAIAARFEAVPGLAPYAEGIGLAVVVLVIAYFTLIFGELVPKRLALSNPEGIASMVATPMSVLARLASPVVRLLSGSTESTLRLFGVQGHTDETVSAEEISLQIALGTRAGIFEPAEQDIVEAVFRLGDRRVGSLMTPRMEVHWLDLESGDGDIVRMALASRHTYYPLARASLDDVRGIVAAWDLLAGVASGEPFDIQALARPILFVPETLPALRLLERFKEHGAHVAVVLDEYGGTQGIVTATDILEALVGDIPKSGSASHPAAVEREDGSWLVDGLLPIDDLQQLLELDDVPGGRSGDYNTVGGLILSRLGRVPATGDAIETDGWRFEIVDMDGHRIDRVVMRESSPGPDG